jgi:hypothetical protein
MPTPAIEAAQQCLEDYALALERAISAALLPRHEYEMLRHLALALEAHRETLLRIACPTATGGKCAST